MPSLLSSSSVVNAVRKRLDSWVTWTVAVLSRRFLNQFEKVASQIFLMVPSSQSMSSLSYMSLSMLVCSFTRLAVFCDLEIQRQFFGVVGELKMISWSQ